MDVTLTSHQQDALDWLVTQLKDGKPLVALRGYAGTGKTTLIPALRTALAQHDLPVVVGSPTHRAAMILRQKGIPDATTVHEHALIPYFKADYRRALAWLGETKASGRLDTCEETPHADVEGLPWLLYTHLTPALEPAHEAKRLVGSLPAKKLLTKLGLHGKDYFDGFGPKLGQGVLIIDEASMVGRSMLDLCQQAFGQVCLIGDPGQLPPVKDEAVLAGVTGRDLTEVHRQAVESPILQLAYQAREGTPFWQHPLGHLGTQVHQSDVLEVQRAAPEAFLESPLIVWRNLTRKTCTAAIRAALGYATQQLYPGEPLVCRSTSQEDRAEGFYNNGLYRIVAVSASHPREVTVEDALGETSTIEIHLEELDGDRIGYHAIPFRFGYCLTAHTAQGGEWPIVYISKLELIAYAAQCLRYARHDELAQWAYTAITRAKDTLCFLTTHTFERSSMPTKPLSPPPTPMMTTTPEEEQPLLTSPVPQPDDDIQEPVIPETLQATLLADAVPPPTLPDKFGEHEALLQGFCQHVQHRLESHFMTYAKTLMRNLDDMAQLLHRQLDIQKDKTQQAETWLDSLTTKAVQDGIQLRHDPYTASVQVVSPQGFPITITVQKQSTEALVEAIPALAAWLAEQQFTAPVDATF